MPQRHFCFVEITFKLFSLIKWLVNGIRSAFRYTDWIILLYPRDRVSMMLLFNLFWWLLMKRLQVHFQNRNFFLTLVLKNKMPRKYSGIFFRFGRGARERTTHPPKWRKTNQQMTILKISKTKESFPLLVSTPILSHLRIVMVLYKIVHLKWAI